MTPWEWAAVGLYAVLCIGLGHMVLQAAGMLRANLMQTTSSAYLCGQLVLHATTLCTMLDGVQLSTLTPFIAASGLAGLAHRFTVFREGQRTGMALANWIAIPIAVALLFPAVLVLTHASATVEWDARMIWMFHAKALYFDGRISEDFFAESSFWWSNLDYPLLLPSQAAWSALIAGSWSSIQCKSHLLCTLFAWLSCAFHVVHGIGIPRIPALCVTMALFLLGEHVMTPYAGFVSGMADRHYATPLVLAVLSLSLSDRHSRLPFSALMLSYAANVKSEGAAFSLLYALVLLTLGRWCQRSGRRHLWGDHPNMIQVGALVTCIGIAPAAAWRLHAESQPTAPGLRLSSQVWDLWPLLQERLPTVVEHVAAAYVRSGASWAILAYGLCLALSPILQPSASSISVDTSPTYAQLRHIAPDWREAWMAAAILTTTLLITMVFVLTPHDYVMHMQMALPRLIILPACHTGALVALRIARWFPAVV